MSPGSRPPTTPCLRRPGGETNVVPCTLADVTRLGERTALMVRANDALLRFTMATRDVRDRGLEVGRALSVQLLPEGIHLMLPAR